MRNFVTNKEPVCRFSKEKRKVRATQSTMLPNGKLSKGKGNVTENNRLGASAGKGEKAG